MRKAFDFRLPEMSEAKDMRIFTEKGGLSESQTTWLYMVTEGRQDMLGPFQMFSSWLPTGIPNCRSMAGTTF